jgi:hypothetical protein
LRRGYTAEVSTAFALFKSVEEQRMGSGSGTCYLATGAYPTLLSVKGKSTVWNPQPGAPPALQDDWIALLAGQRPDANVRFQYEIFANHKYDVAQPGYCKTTQEAKPGTIDCVSAGVTGIIPETIYPAATSSWYVIVARGDLDGDGTNSTFVSAIDDSRIIACNDVE